MHKTALICFSEQRGASVKNCLDESSLRSSIISYSQLNLDSVLEFDAYLILANKTCDLDDLPSFIFKKLNILLWEDELKSLNNASPHFDKIFCYPFNFDEISVLVRNAIFMRKSLEDNGKLILSDLVLDFNVRDAARDGNSLKLSHKEFCLLEYFMRNRSRALTRNQILDNVWDRNENIFTNTIDVHVAKLRKKLDPQKSDRFIKTVHGFGYIMDV